MPKKAMNSFYFYMLDYKQTEEAKGRRFPGGMKEVALFAGEQWKVLTASERAKYKQKGAKKYTTQGECLEDVELREDDAQRARDAQRTEIQRMIGAARVGNTLRESVFLLMDVNFFCETNDRFVVNEVSIINFSIADGLGRFFHKIVDPVSIPTGFASDAKMSFEVHNFPMPPLPQGESDPIKVFAEVMDYLEDFKEPSGKLPPLFTHPDKVAPVQSFLEQMCDYCGEDVNIFRLYQLHQLLFDLTAALKNASNEGLPTEALALTEIRKDPFQYHLHLACEFHEETEVHHNCSLSRVKRWAFTVLDHCCPLANIPMVPGCHLPRDVDVEVVAQVKERHEEAREEAAAREERVSKPFQFINWGLVPEAARPPPSAASALFHKDEFPTLGGPARSRQPTAPSSSNSPVGSTKSGPASGATSKRAPLRIPDGDAEGSFGCFGRGRGTASAWGPKK